MANALLRDSAKSKFAVRSIIISGRTRYDLRYQRDHIGKELKIQRQIRLAEDDLVARIQTALDNFRGLNKLEEAQYRNLLHVAASTESSEVIKNFLRYQVGRDDKWGRGEGSLAEAIIKDIDNWIHQRAIAIAREAGIERASPKVNEIKIDLIRRYLGYGARYLKYKREGGGS